MQVVQLLYFAWVRERTGREAEELIVPEGIVTIGDLAAMLAARGAGFAEAFADTSRLRCALDQQLTGFDAAIGAAREIAFFPPVTGG